MRLLGATLGVAVLATLGGARVGAQPSVGVALHAPPVPARLAKLDARLQSIALGRTTALAEQLTRTDDGVVVIVEPAAGVTHAEDAVRAAGGEVNEHAAGLVEATVPVDRLAALAQKAGVARVRAPALHRPAYISEGVYYLNALKWHEAGLTGAGVKVAVIDVGFGNYYHWRGSELPLDVTVQDYCNGRILTSDEHGTAVAEIVHDVAPDAQLYLICIDTEVDLARAEQYAKEQGIAIVNHSVVWYNTSRGDGTGGPGTPDAIVRDARANGILWVNASGNDAHSHWSGKFSDPDDDGAMPLPGPFVAPRGRGDTICVALKWDAWPVTTQDFDLVLFVDGAVVASSVTRQADQPGKPTEEACYRNPTNEFQIVTPVVSAFSTPLFDGRLDVFVLGSDAGFAVAAGSITEPASSPAAVAVGAQGFCSTGRNAQADYSSRGPTIDGRPAPDVIAPSPVSTGTYSMRRECGGFYGFEGTSAAAPHIAGALALVKQRYAALGPSGLHSWLSSMVQETDAPGPGPLWLGPFTELGPVAYSDGQVAVANADGSYPRRLGVTQTSAPSFSPDGRRIAYSRAIDGNLELGVVNADGSNPVRLTFSPEVEVEPTWSPDGSKILFSSARGGTPGLFTINPDGTGETRLTSFAAHEPEYSPDGSKIAYVAETVVGLPAGVRNDIYVMNANGTGSVNLTNGNPGPASSPTFSPDGSTLVFASNLDVWRIPVGGGPRRNLTGNAYYNEAPEFAPDGWITFVRGSALLSVMDEFGGHPGQVTELWPRRVATPSWGLSTAPWAAAAPVISGEARVGQFVVSTNGIWHGRSPIAASFQWLHCGASGDGCTPIPGATDTLYRIADADAGARLRVRVTATNILGSTAALSAPTGVTSGARPVNVAPPGITGPIAAGTPAVATPGAWAPPASAFEYRWLRCDTRCVTIAGATEQAYTPSAPDVGKLLRVAVSAGGTVATSPAVSVGPAGSAPPPPPPPPPSTTTVTTPTTTTTTTTPTVSTTTTPTVSTTTTTAITTTTAPIAPATPPAKSTGVRRTGNVRNNVLVGTPFADVLRGLGGNDVLRGLGGADVLEGGAGNDLLMGGSGADVIRCGPGKDRVLADRRDRVARDCERVRR
jgi:subtilase family protein/WD40 repeat protein/hemolysin type calcium-binding protein